MNSGATTTTTVPSSPAMSSPPPPLPSSKFPLFLDCSPFLSPSTFLPLDHSPPTPTPPPPPPPSASPRSSKKRSRASRRAPTTVLTTDTSNFRAMVQKFTGIPTPPLSTPLSSSPLLSLPQTLFHSHSPFILHPFPQKPQTSATVPNTLPPLPPFTPLSLSSNNFQSLLNAQLVFAAKPPGHSPEAFSMAGREEAQPSREGGVLDSSWFCPSDD